MRREILFILCVLITVTLGAQGTSNPFELSPRLDPNTRNISDSLPDVATENPFELDRAGRETAIDTGTATPSNPFDVAPANIILTEDAHSPSSSEVATAPKVAGKTEQTDGTLLLLAVVLLSILTLCLIFFRTVYSKAYRALFNDNLLSQLYREREAGAFGIFLITYGLFFLAAGLFLALTLRHFGILPTTDSLLIQYTYLTLAISGLMILKHLFLAIVGYVFPVSKETRRYSFTIMIFSIVIGFLLALSAVILAFIDIEYRNLVVYINLGVLLVLYLIRTLRGGFIAGRFIGNNKFHFLSYICAVEIGPALCLLKYLTDF